MTTTSSVQDKVQSLKALSNKSLTETKDFDFKTSNPYIFPSLHPLSNSYKERIQKQPYKVSETLKGFDLEPVKKVKLDNHSEKIVQRQFETKLENDGIKEEEDISFGKASQTIPSVNPKKFKAIKKTPHNIKKYKTKKIVGEIQNLMKKDDKEDALRDQPLVVKDNLFQDYKMFQKQKLNIVSKGSVGNPEPFRSRQINSFLQGMNFERDQVVQKMNQTNFLPNQNVNPFDFQSLYKNFQVEYLSVQLKQMAPSLFEICQKNQQELSENLNKKRLGSFDVPRDESDKTSDKSHDHDEKDPIKQEIQC